MPGRDIVVVGASAGGIEALGELMDRLAADIEAALCVVVHIPPVGTSKLAEVIQRPGGPPVKTAEHGESLRPGRVYVAPPDRHLLVVDGRLVLGRGAHENFHRPAVDPLFRSAARAYGPRVAGVVLSGMLDDGTAGLAAVKACGGLAVVQNPEEAIFSDMPLNALRSVEVDHSLPVAGIADLLAKQAQAPVDGPPVPCAKVEAVQLESELGMSVDDIRRMLQRIGRPASIRCAECQGPLWEIKDPSVLRYRCEVGHAFTAQSLEDGQGELVERALWSAVSALEEKAVVCRRIAERSRKGKLGQFAEIYEQRARKAEGEAENIRRALRKVVEEAGPDRPARARGSNGRRRTGAKRSRPSRN